MGAAFRCPPCCCMCCLPAAPLPQRQSGCCIPGFELSLRVVGVFFMAPRMACQHFTPVSRTTCPLLCTAHVAPHLQLPCACDVCLCDVCMQAQSTGKQLIGVSAESFSLQASLSGSTSSISNPAAGSSGLTTGAALTAAATASRSQQIQSVAGSNSEQQEQQQEDVGVQQESLEQLLQRHMRSLADLVYVSAGKLRMGDRTWGT